jgi:hypothetical protein
MSLGGTWLAANQQLFRSAAGISVPQFDLQEVHPFIGARRVDQVWADARRNIILGTALAPGDCSRLGEYVALAPKESLAQSQLHLAKLSPSGVEFQFSAPGRQLEGTASSQPSDAGFTAVELQDGQIVLRWSGAAVLQRAEQVDGPWTDVQGASSPLTIPLTKPAEFYRIK